ncbi:MAG: hypothetical protein NXI01_04180 [Gammaproteobacteria bacterium]|nr:hypothetical protein [Gammaproteobacteria bacterium]
MAEDQPLDTVEQPRYPISAAVLSLAGAAGVAAQNEEAVRLFLSSIVPVSHFSRGAIQAVAFGAGGLCSGMVNYKLNVGLLNKFFNRLSAKDAHGNPLSYRYESLSEWNRFKYFAGIGIFLVTGILFGLMAFTFALSGPLASLSIPIGLFVTGVMMIQELEAWLGIWDLDKTLPNGDALPKAAEAPLDVYQQRGKNIGYAIAIGNVIALSVLFTLSFAQMLVTLHVAALPALLTGLFVGFTFGAFTEFYFYAPFLSEYCQDFGYNWSLMMAAPSALTGLVTVLNNAFVNAALTYAGVELLTVILVAAGVGLPPAAVITALSAVSALFAGSASFILGLDFWVGDKPKKPVSIATSRDTMYGGSKLSVDDTAANESYTINAVAGSGSPL